MKKSIFVNAVMFNVAWFGLVSIGNAFIPVAAILFGIQCWYFQINKNEVLLIFFVVATGVMLDFTLVYAGFFVFPNTENIPLWLIMLWISFASTIRHSLAFLANVKVLQFVVGGLLAPLSYLAGEKLAAVSLSASFTESYILLACLWAPLMLLIFTLSRWLQKEEKCYAV